MEETIKNALFKEYNYSLPTKIIFGLNSIERVSYEMEKLNAKKALIITDKGIIKAGIVKRVEDNLKKYKKEYNIFDNVRPNPTEDSVKEALNNLRKYSPDILIAVGGGSSIDTAKIAAALDTNSISSIANWEGYGKIKNKRRIPLIAIDTVAGTGSEVTLWAPVINEELRRKCSIGDFSLAPDVAICDPLLTVSVPPHITAETGLDALSHALECYVARGSWEITDALAIKSMELNFKNIRRVVTKGDDIEARKNMMMASLMAGMAFPHAGAGMVHGMGEPLSGFYDLGHGLTMGMLMPYVEEFNLPASYSKFAKIAEVAGENVKDISVYEAARKSINALKNLNRDFNIPSMKEAGVRKEDIAEIVKEAAEDEGNMQSNPRKMKEDDIRKIYEKAYCGE